MRLTTTLLATGLALISLPIIAQEVASTDVGSLDGTPAVGQATAKEEPSFSLSGYADAYFQHVLTDAKGADGSPLTFPTSFAQETRGFGVGNVNLLAEKALGKVGFVGQVGFGPRADAANGRFPNLQQLFVTYSPSDAITLTMGQFGTFVGYEVIDAVANMNYSTSYLFSYGPFFHTGLKADFALGESFGAMVGVFNNTDSRFNDAGYYYGAQLSTETGGIAAYLNFLYGTDTEDVSGDDDATTFQVDLTATYEVSETIMLGLNASRKSTENLIDDESKVGHSDGFTGIALYGTVGITDNASLNLRSEYFVESAPEDITLDGRGVFAITASGNFNIGDLRIIPEFRFDSSADFAGTYSDGIINYGTDNDEDNSIATFIVAAVYAF
ncbi:porin [Neolewinella antarctica]|uniref:Porin n=1 Tax=Neolewinella antarctica TaxID=442734 RepID=A0ABX0XBA1_9BACT|nr:porin [Neolewinella antarctica]NJC26530.1 hypothetical protein [Neolewinella antarctica]